MITVDASTKDYTKEVRLKIISSVIDAVKVSAELVTSQAKRFVPVDTGRLRNAITQSKVEKKGNIIESIVSANTDYASNVEFGTQKQKAQPYMRPARDTQQSAIIDLLSRSVERATKK